MNITGNHPYADAFPMASEDELAELASSIAAVGLIHPVVLTPKGEVLDGRNRLAACKIAGVEPTFEPRDGDDDDYKEFVIGANTTGRRESMTVQIAAASTALILGHEKRINGQWSRGAVKREFSPNDEHSAWRFAIKCAGLVLDELGPAHLIEVRDGTATLNAKFEQARRVKEERETAEARKVQAAKDAEEREARAVAFFENDESARAWLDEKPDGAYTNMRAAFAAIQEEREEIRAAEEARKRQEDEEKRVIRERIERHARYLEAFVTNFKTGLDMADNPERAEILGAVRPDIANRFIEIENTYLKGAQ